MSIYEGDIILFYEQKANGFLSAISRRTHSSSFSHVTIQPYKEDANGRLAISNVHFLSFKILPEYAYTSSDEVSPFLITKENEDNYLHRKLVFGRRVKLLHLASNLFLSLPPYDDNINESKAGILSEFNESTESSCLFKILPFEKIVGDTVCHNDSVILESVQQKGYHVLCVNNSLTQSYELKSAITQSVFNIHLHSSAHIDVPPNAIRAGYVIRLHNTTINAYICGQGSTMDNIVPDEVKQHSFPTKVGARKKKNTLLPRPHPISGDSFWQIEKSNSPINGETPFVYGEKCRLKHLLTKKYLAVIEKNQIILADNDRRDCDYDFILTSATYNIDRIVELGDTIKLQYIYTIEAETHIKYVSINENNWEWMKESAKENLSGSKWFYLSLKDDSTLEFFTVDSVKQSTLYQFYSFEDIKNVLIKYMQKMNEMMDDDAAFEELYEVLNVLAYKLQNMNKTTYSKMLQTAHIIDLLMGFFTIDGKRELHLHVCEVLKLLSTIKSQRIYLSTDAFLSILTKKGIGAESVLISLAGCEKRVGDYIINKLLAEDITDKHQTDNIKVDLLSSLCFTDTNPCVDTQGIICRRYIQDDIGIFYHVELKHDDVYCFKSTWSADRLLLNELGNTEFDFFISQLKLFGSVCKGINKFSIDVVSKWFPFNEVLLVLKSPKVHPLIKAAFYEFVLSVYIDNSIEASGVDVDSLWKCYLWEKLSTTNEPLKGANVKKNMIEELKPYSSEIYEIIEIIQSQLKKSVLYINNDDENELIFQMLAVLEPMIYFGYCWNVDDDLKFDLEETLIPMLDPSTDQTDNYNNQSEDLKIFHIKLKIVKLIQIFFKQYIYLALEKFLFDFGNIKNNTIKSFLLDVCNPPSTLYTEDMTCHIDSLQSSLLYARIGNYFRFERYRCFDPQHKNVLIDILILLMKCKHDNLRINCARLLFDIFNRESIMLNYAKSAYIVLSAKPLYDEMIPYGSFRDGYDHLKLLIQGSGNEEVCDMLEELISSMIVGEDETEMRTCSQYLIFTTGIFSSIMKFVLKFCSNQNLDETHIKLFKNSCILLQTMCRGNEKIQGEIFVHFSDLLKVTRDTASPIANLLTEVFTDNVRLCEKLPETLIRNVYELASTNSDSVGFLDFMVALEAVIKPFKSTDINSALTIKENIVAQAFSETHQDIFKELMTKDNANQRIKILKECTDESVDLMKLIYLTNLLATCCKGHNMFCEDMCQDIFTLEELVEILTDPQIPIKYKTPFAQILLECYLSTERESIVSLHKLSTNIMFWNHVTTCIQYLISLPETITDEDKRMKIKYFLKKVFEMHMSQTSTYNVDEALKPVCYILHYFTRGIGPLLTSLCVQLKLYKYEKLSLKEYKRIVALLCKPLDELAKAIINLLSPANEVILLASETQANFWLNCLASIDNILPDFSGYQYKINFANKDHYISDQLMEYNKSIQSEVELNEQCQCFVSNCEKIFCYQNFSNYVIKDFMELLSFTPNFQQLIKLFFSDHTELDDFQPLLIIINILFSKLQLQLTSKLCAVYQQILANIFKLLIGIICVNITNFDKGNEYELDFNDIIPIQVALMKMELTDDVSFSQIAIKHISHPNDEIAMHVIAFFTLLILNGNKDNQNKFHNIIVENDNFFIKIHKMIENVLMWFNHSLKFVTVKDKDQQKAEEKEEIMLTDEEDILDNQALLRVTSFREEQVVLKEDDDVPVPVCEHASTMSEQLDKVISGANLVMRLLSAMCDGQHRAMQNTLRYQKQCKTRCNIVSDVASLLQGLAEVPVSSNITVIINAIQALIEICAGNFANQKVALNCQVIGSINIILKHQLKSMDGIHMQCKAIELLEVLLEETHVKYSEIFEAIYKDLKISYITCFIENVHNALIGCSIDIENTRAMTKSTFRAYHILLNIASKKRTSFCEFVGLSDWDDTFKEPWRYLKKNTYSIEVNYITKDDKEILTKVYFPFSHKREMTKQEKKKLQAEINRDDPEDKVKDLLEWTQSVWKNDKHKEFLRNYLLIQILLYKPFVRWVILTLLTIILNILVLAFFKVPQFSNCPYYDPGNNFTLIIIPKPYECWLSYEYILLYLFGFPHLIFSLWMAIEFFIVEKPNLIFLNQTTINYFISNFSILKTKFPILKKCWDDQQVKNTLHRKGKCFDIYFFSIYPLVCIFFVLSSLLGLLTYGYFYCFCLVITFSTINVIQQVIKAVSGKVWQLTFVALLMISVMFVYAVLSYAFMSTFFNIQSNLFCRTLWECFVTVMREGILDTFGNKIPVTYVNQSGPNFDVYLWRAIIDLSFYVVINIIGLNIITAILVDRFSELRAERDAALKDQKEVCFICGISNDKFEREGKGFMDHYKNDHNVYSYIYYVLYIKSKSTQDHNAIEKYVYDMFHKKSIKFYPLHKAKVLGY